MAKSNAYNQVLNQREVRKFLSSVEPVTKDRFQKHIGRIWMVQHFY